MGQKRKRGTGEEGINNPEKTELSYPDSQKVRD